MRVAEPELVLQQPCGDVTAVDRAAPPLHSTAQHRAKAITRRAGMERTRYERATTQRNATQRNATQRNATQYKDMTNRTENDCIPIELGLRSGRHENEIERTHTRSLQCNATIVHTERVREGERETDTEESRQRERRAGREREENREIDRQTNRQNGQTDRRQR